MTSNKKKTSQELYPRAGCQDIWNAHMVNNCIFSPESDIPFCPCNIDSLPTSLISYEDAKMIYNRELKAGNLSFHNDSYIHFYMDDQKFDGKQNSIWLYPDKALQIITHFSGIISPDFSTNADFPDPIKRFNTYRMRAFGRWVSSFGIPTINNVRWGSEETWSYCFDGIPNNSIVCIGTVASGLRYLENRPLFEAGFRKMIEILTPKAIIIYGSANYHFISEYKEKGVNIVSFPSKTSLFFERRTTDV